MKRSPSQTQKHHLPQFQLVGQCIGHICQSLAGRARPNSGVEGGLIIGSHNEIAQTNFQNAMSSVIDYVNNQHPTEMEFTTHRKILAPYNRDTLVG